MEVRPVAMACAVSDTSASSGAAELQHTPSTCKTTFKPLQGEQPRNRPATQSRSVQVFRSSCGSTAGRCSPGERHCAWPRVWQRSCHGWRRPSGAGTVWRRPR
eukprot:6593061-Prymnesium_polylepis.1